MPLPTLPTPPSRDDPANFSARADAFLAALPAFGDGANALEQSLQMVATTGTSTTSLAIGTGSKTLTTQAGKAWVVGAFVYIASSASVANLMFGQITAYNSETGSLTVNVLSYTGSGTLAAWSIGLSVPRGGTETFSGTVYAARFEVDSGFALYLSSGVSTILLDTNDLLRFTRSTNTFDVVIGGTAEFSVTANGPERPDDASTANGLVRKSQLDTAIAGVTPPASSAEAQAGSSTVKAVTPKALADTVLGGNGQSVQAVSGSRLINTTYTNSTGRPIFVSVYGLAVGSNADFYLAVNSVAVSRFSSASWATNSHVTLQAVVPNGATYSVVTVTGNFTIVFWNELR